MVSLIFPVARLTKAAFARQIDSTVRCESLQDGTDH